MTVSLGRQSAPISSCLDVEHAIRQLSKAGVESRKTGLIELSIGIWGVVEASNIESGSIASFVGVVGCRYQTNGDAASSKQVAQIIGLQMNQYELN